MSPELYQRLGGTFWPGFTTTRVTDACEIYAESKSMEPEMILSVRNLPPDQLVLSGVIFSTGRLCGLPCNPMY